MPPVRHCRRRPEYVRNEHAYYREQDIIQRMRKNIFFGGAEYVPAIWRKINLSRIASVISEAFRNTVELPVTMSALSKAQRGKRTKLLESIHLGKIVHPTRVTSLDGIPVLWALPGIYTEDNQMNLANAASSLSPILGQGGDWRNGPAYIIKTPDHQFPLGSNTFSPAWFATGQQLKSPPPKPSASLQDEEHEHALTKWLRDSVVGHQTANIIIGILHPKSYKHGANDLRSIRRSSDPATQKWSKLWSSVFTAISVIGNRWCARHTDSKGDLTQFDVLVNTGTARNELFLSQMNASIQYDPGTAIVFSGRLFFHEVPAWTEGERVGHAFFMRKEVQIRYNKKPVPCPEAIL